MPDFLWQADRIGMVRKAYGASEERLPRFRPDGTPLRYEEFATAADPADPAALAEAIHLLHAQGRNVEAMTLAGIEVDQETERRLYGRGRSLPHHLAMLEFERLLPWLLAAGLDVDDRDRHQRTPLHEAVLHRDLPLARALLAAGADPSAWDNDGVFAGKPPRHAETDRAFAVGLKKLVAQFKRHAPRSVGRP